jgi:S1-C subfamily serine protease
MLKNIIVATVLGLYFISQAAFAATPVVEDAYSPTVQIHIGKGHGSGTIIYSKNKRTFILTNAHVAENHVAANKAGTFFFLDITIDTFKYESLESITKTQFLANVVLMNKKMDLALLEIDAEDLPVARLDLTLRPELGENVFAIGGGFSHTPFLTAGFLNQSEDIDGYPYYLSTAPTIPGNSGGGLYMNCGENLARFCLIGVPARIFSVEEGRVPIPHMGFTIKITTLAKFLEKTNYEFIFKGEPVEKPDAEKESKDKGEPDSKDEKEEAK